MLETKDGSFSDYSDRTPSFTFKINRELITIYVNNDI